MMFKPNLLPWREEKQASENKKFKLQIFLALLIGVSAILIWRGLLAYEIQQIKIQQKDLQHTLIQLEPQIAAINQLKKDQIDLTSALKTAQKIAAQQKILVQLLNDLSQIAPTIILMQLQKNAATITLQGKSNTGSAIMQLLQKLAKLPYTSAAKLLSNPLENNFTITFQLE